MELSLAAEDVRTDRDTHSAAFQAALMAGDIKALRQCPKADLHNHGVLGGDREFILSQTGRRIAPLEQPLCSMDELHCWSKANVGDLYLTRPGRGLLFEAAFVQAKRDGVTRLEMGDDAKSASVGGTPAAEVTADLLASHRRAAPEIEWIPQLGLSRNLTVEALERWLVPHLELGIWRTLDLAGDERAQPIEVFAPLYRKAQAAGLRLKAHVGEWGSADDIWRAVELLELDEVQHGIAAAESPAVMKFLANHDIPLHICPTSNLLLGRVDSLKNHPIRVLFDAGVRVTVNTDDVLLFGHGVSEEFMALYRSGLFSAAELDTIRRGALEGSTGGWTGPPAGSPGAQNSLLKPGFRAARFIAPPPPKGYKIRVRFQRVAGRPGGALSPRKGPRFS